MKRIFIILAAFTLAVGCHGLAFAGGKKNLDRKGHGERLVENATTDVWSLGNFAYTGTLDSPCGGNPDAGVWVWDVRNKNKPSFAGVIPSPAGSRSNDVKAATMNSGDILVHSNQPCAGGPGGFEIYNVDDPLNPVFLAHVQTDDVNIFLRNDLGLTDFGVHNLFLFSQGGFDYAAAVVESEFGNFQIYDITDPTTPTLVGFWGAESLLFPAVDFATTTDFGGVILPADAYLFDGFGNSQNRFLNDVTVSADGTRAYLSNWDAGLVLLDISDTTDPQLISVALDEIGGSLDGEVNSAAAWPSEDGSIVVEAEEDISAWEGFFAPGNFTMDSGFPGDPTIPATAISTVAGDDFEANQTGNLGTVDGSSVAVTSGPLAGNTYPAIELLTAVGSPTFADTGALTGKLVWVGRACATTLGDVPLNPIGAGDIAVVRRGDCFFEEKTDTTAALGAAAMVMANNVDSTPWGGLRIWDYTDPANPVLASTFNTTCSASTAPGGDCDLAGNYTAHNVQVETRGNKVFAYVSWNSDGMFVLDVTDPYNPEQIARFFDNSDKFKASNGGNPHNFWGVYKQPNSPWILGSDRNGGLSIFKDVGGGKSKKKKK